ncbi:hypothetical protein ADUPG1_011891 [Aduncisulcus paluster]|uniref:Uncharacterized protein n=1 Tax=Aduncisulcus paluster TaxID=2918883 RepID=A0ABQ5JZU9_9EUKA|nr:hypothetical protein ADUPG1_011891 [Aduncisulcus paluster]
MGHSSIFSESLEEQLPPNCEEFYNPDECNECEKCLDGKTFKTLRICKRELLDEERVYLTIEMDDSCKDLGSHHFEIRVTKNPKFPSLSLEINLKKKEFRL